MKLILKKFVIVLIAFYAFQAHAGFFKDIVETVIGGTQDPPPSPQDPKPTPNPPSPVPAPKPKPAEPKPKPNPDKKDK